MSRTRTNDRLSEIEERVVAAAEADLNRLLAIEPSPEFAAKVRVRIREPQAARGWSAGWLGFALASVAALVMAVAFHSDPVGGPSPKTAPLPATSGPGLKTGPLPVAATAPPRVDVRVAPVGSGLKTALPPAASRVVEVHRPGDPEVLIDPSLAQAIRRLASTTRSTPLDATAPEASLQPISDTSVPSVVVEPLTVPELVLKPADQHSGW